MKKYELTNKPFIWRSKDGKFYHLGDPELKEKGLPDKVFTEIEKTGKIKEVTDGEII